MDRDDAIRKLARSAYQNTSEKFEFDTELGLREVYRRSQEKSSAQIASVWASKMASLIYGPIPYPELEKSALEITQNLVELLLAEPFDPVPAAGLGAKIAGLGAAYTDTLECSLIVLGDSLLGAANVPISQFWHSRLVRLTASLSAGYSNAIRERVLDSQEAIKRALLKAQQDAYSVQLDHTGRRIQHIGAKLCEFLGIPPNELLLDHLFQACVSPGDQGDITELFNSILDGRSNETTRDVRVTLPGGERVPTKLSIVRSNFNHQDRSIVVSIVPSDQIAKLDTAG